MALTAAGIQPTSLLARSRALVAALDVATFLLLAPAMAHVLRQGVWTVIDVAMFVCFLFAAPWSVLGFWTAAIGLWLLHGSRDAMQATAPFAAAGEGQGPVPVATAVLLTLRNEDPDRAFARLGIVKDSID